MLNKGVGTVIVKMWTCKSWVDTACYSFLVSKLMFFNERKLQRNSCKLQTVLIPHARDLNLKVPSINKNLLLFWKERCYYLYIYRFLSSNWCQSLAPLWIQEVYARSKWSNEVIVALVSAKFELPGILHECIPGCSVPKLLDWCCQIVLQVSHFCSLQRLMRKSCTQRQCA